MRPLLQVVLQEPMSKRRKHDIQKQPIEGVKGFNFMQSARESARIGTPSIFEIFVICSIIKHLNGSNTCDENDINSSEVHKVYTSVCMLSKLFYIALSLFQHSEADCTRCVQYTAIRKKSLLTDTSYMQVNAIKRG